MKSRVLEAVVRVMLVLVGVITATPALMLVSPVRALEVAYGVDGDLQPMVLALLQHRGMLQGVLGAALVWSAFQPSARIPVALVAITTNGDGGADGHATQGRQPARAGRARLPHPTAHAPLPAGPNPGEAQERPRVSIAIIRRQPEDRSCTCFTTPRWVAAAGGWAEPTTADRYARFCARAAGRLGEAFGRACTPKPSATWLGQVAQSNTLT